MLSHGKIVSILQFFTDKFDDYWHILYPIFPLEERERNKHLYFYDISRKATGYNGKFSSEGVYQFLGYDKQYHIHALEIAQYALACWQAWCKTGYEYWANKAILHCDWLLKHQEIDGAWRIEHKNPSYNDLLSPWPSAMAQGLAISALIRAYFYTDDEKYLNSAEKACLFLEVSVEKNGVKRFFNIDGENLFVYEEYPRKKLSGVLNGYITSILGVYELSLIDDLYKKQLYENIENLLRILPLYDAGYWSYYSLDKNISSGFYHRYVIKQLSVLEMIDKRFKHYRELFDNYLKVRTCQLKALINKVLHKL